MTARWEAFLTLCAVLAVAALVGIAFMLGRVTSPDPDPEIYVVEPVTPATAAPAIPFDQLP